MLHIAIKPADKLIKGYYDVLGGLGQLHFDHEGAVRTAFHDVLAGYGKKLHWTLVDEYPMKGRQGRIAIDGALLDEWKQRHGFWEAKDIHDQVSTDKRSGITNDPNRDDREYILRLIGRVITVSLETVQIVKSLPEFVLADFTAAGA